MVEAHKNVHPSNSDAGNSDPAFSFVKIDKSLSKGSQKDAADLNGVHAYLASICH
jgi:hypothetical protein